MSKPSPMHLTRKLKSPSAERNKTVIAEVLSRYLPDQGTVLEIASGSGQHVVHFAKSFPGLNWQASDCSQEKNESILSYLSEAALSNLLKPIYLDILESKWHAKRFNFILNINMIHISPKITTRALFEGAFKVLQEQERVFLYGPFFERQVQTAESNLAFHQWLQERDQDYGLRQREDVEEIAATCGFKQISRTEMPANNLALVFEKKRF